MDHPLSPINRLPPECLSFVFKCLRETEHVCDPPEPATLSSPRLTFCALVQKRWRALVKALWPHLKTPPDELLFFAAFEGHSTLMSFAKKQGATHFGEVIAAAANQKHIGCMKLAKKWFDKSPHDEYIVFGLALISAALSGNIRELKLVKKWGGKTFDTALYNAVQRGHIEVMIILKQWGAVEFDTALYYAAKKGQIESMKLLKTWQAVAFDAAFEKASKCGQIEAMKLLKKWGAMPKRNG